MNKLYAILWCIIITGFVNPYPVYSTSYVYQSVSGDTLIVNKLEDEVIQEAIESKAPIKKEKVEYLHQVTQYGFKNLFKSYTYNAAMPYSAQVNPYAENYMQDYLQSHQKYLTNLRQTGVTYFNFIDRILVQYGLPKELKYLAVIESNLKATALSSAGARGPWQFMIYTAKDYGLKVNQLQDDRIDYEKSTHAASKYLLNLYKDLKDWLLVIAAYNGGPGRVYSAIKKSGSRNFWDLQYYLPQESRNHVKKFIATHYIMESAAGDSKGKDVKFDYTKLALDEINTSPTALSVDEKSDVAELSVSGRYKAAIIARNLEMELGEFDRYNPGFDAVLMKGDSYQLSLPNDKMTLFVANKYPILNECVQQLLGNVIVENKTVYPNKKASEKKK